LAQRAAKEFVASYRRKFGLKEIVDDQFLTVGVCGKDNRDRFAEAIFKDVGKPPVQVEVLETLCVVNEVCLLIELFLL
jgi:hypothetical protein